MKKLKVLMIIWRQSVVCAISFSQAVSGDIDLN